MALLLPDFKDRKCLELHLCGFLRADEAATVESLSESEEALISRYSKSGRDVYLGLLPPFWAEDGHVHLRLAVPEFFEETPPKVNAQPEDVLRAVEPLLGREINLDSFGLFRVSQTELSPLIRSTFVETTVGKVQVRMTGGTLSVRGAPIHTITWKLLGVKGLVEFVLEARTKTKLGDSYLVDALGMIESAFAAFVVAGNRNE